MPTLRAAALLLSTICVYPSQQAYGAEALPERKQLQAGSHLIEFSAGDEAFASALAAQLPLDVSSAQPESFPVLPVTIGTLRGRRTDILTILAGRLALPAPTAEMEKTFDRFASAFSLMQSMDLEPTASRFALWRKPELEARLGAGQEVNGFRRTSDGEVEFSVGAEFQILEGEAPEKSIARMRDSWNRVTWPIKIGAEPTLTPEAEIRQQLAGLRENVRALGRLQSAEVQRMSVVLVLHEIVESTLLNEYIRSADRRWFCEGVANYLAYEVLKSLAGPEAARGYYDVGAEAARYAGLRDKVDLSNWPVMEDPRSQSVPPDVNQASYAFATLRVFEAFEGRDENLLARVLQEIRKTPATHANIDTVTEAYRRVSGTPLR